jgi:mannose-6-phosphate isomerase-like protein (cupin superfamily)
MRSSWGTIRAAHHDRSRRTGGVDPRLLAISRERKIMTARKSALLTAIAALAFAPGAWAQAGQPQSAPAKTYTAAAGTRPVIYTSKGTIDEGFAKNVLILHESEGGHYMVESAQRSKPGSPEIHLKDTDVTYVVKGTATLITGGTVVDMVAQNQTRPGNPHPEYELRGGKIVGGQTFHLQAGDSVVIPPGVPHQFAEVSTPFYYLNIKVRAD